VICQNNGYAYLILKILNILSYVFFLLFCKAVSYEEGEALAKEYNIHFFETSAKQDINVEKAFIKIATDVKNRLLVDGSGVGGGAGASTSGAHRLGAASKPQSNGCCSK
jgi:hypothetical protein